ncbi:MAG: peptidoglycan-binding protein [Desulfotomaculum sp.]|nr:peptidoglycan-binding protein [Desulfotomaculum sp.]
MNNIKTIQIFTFTAALFFLISAAASASEYHLCPFNCCRERLLTLQQPYITGPDVKTLQRELKELGCYQGSIDGIYGIKTAEAVAFFQAEQHLAVTGIVSEKTWQALYQHLDKPVIKETPPPPSGDIVLVVDTVNRTLTLLADGEPYKQYRVAVGSPDTPSPVGTWRVSRKAKNWGTGFGTRWMGLNVRWGMYGIHGTNKPGSIGSYASHGCIRMHNNKVEQLYPWVPTNAPVYIVGNPFGVSGHTHRVLCVGEKGSDVAAVQAYLKRHGYYNQEVDGIFGPGMEKAVFNFRKDHGLVRDNRVNREMYEAMKL